MFPVRIFFADAPAERDRHRSGLDVENLVVLDDLNRLCHVDVLEACVDWLEKHFHVQLTEEVLALLKVRSIAEGKCERLESAKVAAEFAHHRVGCEKHSAAVDTPGKTAADRLVFRDALNPFANLRF